MTIVSDFNHIFSSGNRRAAANEGNGFLVAFTQSSTLASRMYGNFLEGFDGNYASNNGPYYGDGALTTADYFQFEFSEAVVFDSLRMVGGEFPSRGNWQFRGSNDGTTWDDLGAPFTWQNAAGALYGGTMDGQDVTGLTNTTAYLYYRIQYSSGTWSSTHRLTNELMFGGPHSDRGGGNRSSLVTVSRLGLAERNSRTIADLVDGLYKFNGPDQVTLIGPTAGNYLEFDFGTSVGLNRFRINNDGQLSANYGTWKWRGSNDGTTFTDSGSSFVFSNSASPTCRDPIFPGADPADSYRYWRMEYISGIGGGVNINGQYEWIFDLTDGGGGGGVTVQAYPVIIITT